MRQLNKLESIIFAAGGLLMTLGAGCYALLLVQKAAAVAALVGALGFAVMQLRQRYAGTNFVIRRLRRIMSLADILFVVAGLLMVEEQFGPVSRLLASHGSAYITFVNVTYGKWVILLLIAALLEIYTMHRISNELENEP